MPVSHSSGESTASVRPGTEGAAPASASVFSREGEYWTIVYEGVVLRLRDTKGLSCLARLLRHPREDHRATDLLMAGEESVSRSTGSSSPPTVLADRERARVLVTKHIRAAIERIATHHPSLGHHLETCIMTGSSCRYMPDPQRAPPWKL